jgi:sec-independent protein translocase protein TatC
MALVPFPKKSTSSAPDDDPDWEDEEPDSESDKGKMSFLDHLDELRRRIVWSLVALFLGFVICVAFLESYEIRAFGRVVTTPGIFDFIMGPMAEALDGAKLQFLEPTEPLMLRLKMAALAGLVLSSPFIMWQVWLFIAPGLYANEKKFALPFAFFASALFISGAAFSHYILFPFAWKFFASFSGDILEFMPRVEPIFGLYVKLMLAMGLVFQLPMLIFVLARFGMVTAGFLVKNFKFAVLIFFVVSAIITPDGSMVPQIIMAGSMVTLYGVSIGVAWIFAKKRDTED